MGKSETETRGLAFYYRFGVTSFVYANLSLDERMICLPNQSRER